MDFKSFVFNGFFANESSPRDSFSLTLLLSLPPSTTLTCVFLFLERESLLSRSRFVSVAFLFFDDDDALRRRVSSRLLCVCSFKCRDDDFEVMFERASVGIVCFFYFKKITGDSRCVRNNCIFKINENKN